MQEKIKDDTISRQAAIAELNEIAEMKNAILDSLNISDRRARDMIEAELGQINDDIDSIKSMPSAQPEQTEYIQDTKAVPDDRDMVCLSERVIATYYDDEHEEWSQKTVTIADVLDSVCDDYTVLPSAQPEQRPLTEDNYVYCAECDSEVKCLSCGHHKAERPFEVYCNIMCKWVNEKDYCTMFELGQEKKPSAQPVERCIAKIQFNEDVMKEIVDKAIIRCNDCEHRYTEDCPMYHVEWVEYDDDGYIEMDDIEYDNTEDDGFCHKAERRTDD